MKLFWQTKDCEFFFSSSLKGQFQGSDALIIHSWPMVSSHDLSVVAYVEGSDWATSAKCCDLIGPSLCVVRCHWSPVTGSFGGSGVLSVSVVKAAHCARLSLRLLSEELKSCVVCVSRAQ